MNDTRRFLAAAIESGLDFGVLSPDDLIRHVHMEVLAHHLSVDLKARLLKAALEADAMTAALVVDTLGIEVIAEAVPAPLLWEVISETAGKLLDGKVASAPEPATDEKAEGPKSAPLKPPLSAGRKPNRSRAPRVRAGATSRPKAPAPVPDEEESPFDVDTRVGAEAVDGDFDVIDETNVPGSLDDVTAHGHES